MSEEKKIRMDVACVPKLSEDEKNRREAWNSCKRAKIDPPPALLELYGVDGPKPNEIPIGNLLKFKETQWVDAMGEEVSGTEVTLDLSDLPPPRTQQLRMRFSAKSVDGSSEAVPPLPPIVPLNAFLELNGAVWWRHPETGEWEAVEVDKLVVQAVRHGQNEAGEICLICQAESSEGLWSVPEKAVSDGRVRLLDPNAISKIESSTQEKSPEKEPSLDPQFRGQTRIIFPDPNFNWFGFLESCLDSIPNKLLSERRRKEIRAVGSAFFQQARKETSAKPSVSREEIVNDTSHAETFDLEKIDDGQYDMCRRFLIELRFLEYTHEQNSIILTKPPYLSFPKISKLPKLPVTKGSTYTPIEKQWLEAVRICSTDATYQCAKGLLDINKTQYKGKEWMRHAEKALSKKLKKANLSPNGLLRYLELRFLIQTKGKYTKHRRTRLLLPPPWDIAVLVSKKGNGKCPITPLF